MSMLAENYYVLQAIWLPDLDLNQDYRIQSAVAYH